jgi:hypothetical protein
MSARTTEPSKPVSLWLELRQIISEGPPTVDRTSRVIAKLIHLQRLLEDIAETGDIDQSDQAKLLIGTVENLIDDCIEAKDIALRWGYTNDEDFTKKERAVA